MRGAWAALGLAGAAAVVASGSGCGPTDPVQVDPWSDPSLPGVDASSNATPVEAPSELDGGGSRAPRDAGKTTAPPPGDAGGDGPTVPKPAAGEVLVTEVMYNPFGPEPGSEWFELHNGAASPRSLSGLTIVDGSSRFHVIGAGVVIAPGAYAVLARDATTAIAQKIPADAILYSYGVGLPDNAGVLLLNGTTGRVTLMDGATKIAESAYGGWYSLSGGSSVQLKVLDATASAQAASWCLSLNPWTTGSEKGTPGAASDCP